MVEAVVTDLPFMLLVIGLVLMAMEAISPGAHFVVIGVALVGAGLIGMLFPPFAAPLVLAAFVLGFGAVATWIYREFDFYGGKGTAQTKDSTSLAGSTGYATEVITGRKGKVKLQEGGFSPYYSARTSSGRIEEGEEIIVIDPGGGNVLTVEALSTVETDDIDRELARDRAADRSSEGVDSSAVDESVSDREGEPATDSE